MMHLVTRNESYRTALGLSVYGFLKILFLISSRCSSPREKEKKEEGSRLWSKVKYQLVKFEALPEYLRDNEYIRGHYRLNWPLGPTLLSLFSFHNETLNIWTHFLGFLLFLGLTIFTVRKLPTYVEPCLEQLLQMPSYLHLPEEFASCLDPSCFSGTGSEDCSLVSCLFLVLKKHITRWPFFVFLGGAMFCLLSSTTCHLFSCISPHCSYLLLRLDYTGIALLIAGSFYPPVYYSFACNPFLRDMYLTTITIIGIGTVLASLLPVFETTKYRTFRACLFFGMGISGVIPCIHKLFLYQDIEPILYQTLFMEIAMGIFYGLGALVYATRIPERWKPGMFDILGNSHQLFHLLVIAGAYTHYESGLLYLKWRDVKGCGA
ncbi:unnamed protein product [Sphagnum jensenii]|uniref:Uncharacterized protein n=1 Tax=Sphagnum jensenii TaxID=128206 RepID=A0ABP1AT27_9BRYO